VAFDHLACALPPRACAGCALAPTCVIPTWLDHSLGGQSPPYVLDARWREGGLEARWSLVGAPPEPRLLLAVLRRAGANGLGPARVPFALQQVDVVGAEGRVTVLADGALRGAWPPPTTLAAWAPPLDLPWSGGLATPLRRKGSVDPLSLSDLITMARSRLRGLERTLGLPPGRRWPDPPAALERPLPGLVWRRLARPSGRGAGTQDLSGWVGPVSLPPDLSPWADLLGVAARLGLGPGGAFGLGRLDPA
jgi:hypothetical protein